MRQLFERLPPAPPSDAGDARFEHFKMHVWPRIKSGGDGAVLGYFLDAVMLLYWSSGSMRAQRVCEVHVSFCPAILYLQESP